ncbi:C39 family peptidase [Candidatus Woesebacteria bacterium]|nr:C39 family peptidase [Candidatus Woesebacteria bacterium]QQG47146.1 MAG: C39 family peptidase [Candidatus Woesebacteria bacterium]
MFLLFSISPKQVSANTIIFNDDFENGVVDKWTEISNLCKFNGSKAEWMEVNGKFGIIINGGSCSTFIMPDYVTIDSTTNYSVEADVTFTQSIYMDRNLIVKFKDLHNWYGLHFVGTDVYLDKVVNGVEYFLPNKHFNYNFSENGEYNIKTELNSGVFKIFIDGTLVQTIVDEMPFFGNLTAGLAASAGSIPQSEVWFDNFKIEILDNSLPVPDLKQYSDPWGGVEYDSASKWALPDKISIARWGCALTSADMVLRYYNHDILPDALNDWLKNNNGYNRIGWINWPAISRFSKINTTKIDQNKDLTHLEWNYFSADKNIVTDSLSNNIPTILHVPGHFLTTKGVQNSDFIVNDPASDKTLLSDVENLHGGSFDRIDKYTPANTDLSYLVFYVDPTINMHVFDSNDNEITGFNFVEDLLIDDLDSSPANTNSLNTFAYPKPTDGNYKVKLSGNNGSYQLDSYLYNRNGELTLNSYNGLISDGEVDQFLMTSGNTPKSIQIVSIDSIIEDLDNAYNLGLINNKGIYRALRADLLVGKRFIDKGKIGLAKLALGLEIAGIKRATPKFIEQNASDILISEIKILIEQL